MPNASPMSLTQELAGLKTIAAALRPDSCTIQRATMSAGGGDTWTDIATVSCHVVSAGRIPRDRTVNQAERLVAEPEWKVALPAGQDVAIGDRILFGTRTFKVVEVRGTSFEVQRYALATEMVKA